jgi:integrase
MPISSNNFHFTYDGPRTSLFFGCTTGLRVSDLMLLKQKNLTVRNNTTYLNLYTKKTSTNVVIPLPEYCIDILKKHKGRCNGYLLPRLSNTNLNLQIKSLGKLANWTDPLPKYRTKKGKLLELKNVNGTCWKFYQHISTHTMRRTAITSLLMLGVDEAVVRRLSGHAPGSKEFYRYMSLAQSYLDQQIQLAPTANSFTK